MTAARWRLVAIALAVACALMWWRGRGARAPRTAAPATAATATDRAGAPRHGFADDGPRAAGDDATPDDDGAPDDGVVVFGVRLPAWLAWFAPQPGEDLLAYRDRMVPLAQAAVAPHRERVQRGRAAFEQEARLDDRQRAELDAAVDEAGAAIQDRILQGVLSGELMPGQLKPSTGVAFVGDVLDAVEGANARFTRALRDDQREALAHHPFDVADYLLFSVRWEDMLGVTE
jgi:hypothetical protein